MATLGAVMGALVKNKQKLSLMQRYFTHSEFTDDNTVASVLRWVRDNPGDVAERPSSQRVGLWNNKRMHEALRILGEVLTSDAVRAIVETDKPVSQSEYDGLVACVEARCTEFEKDVINYGGLVSIAATMAAGQDAASASPEDECDDDDDCDHDDDEPVSNGKDADADADADDDDDDDDDASDREEEEEESYVNVDPRVAARIETLEDGMRNIRAHMTHFAEQFGDEKFFAVCVKTVLYEISKLVA